MDNRSKFFRIVSQRVHSLTDDNYYIRVRYVSTDSATFVLRHRTNGKVIIIRGDYKQNRMIQNSGGRVVYDDKVLVL